MSRVLRSIRDRLEEDEDEDLMDFISTCDESDIGEEDPIEVDKTFPTVIFICNIPQVGKEKYDKLLNVLNKTITKASTTDFKMVMPMNEETEKTHGFVIVTYKTADEADNAMKTLDGISLDKNHSFKVIKMDQFDDISSRPDEFKPVRAFTESKTRRDFRDNLLDSKCREQILMRYQSETEIYWHDTMEGQPVLCYGGEREKRNKKIWCDWRVQWSPQGTYLATFHQQGIALWAGPEFVKQMRFAHEKVRNIEFSPNEEFILTWNGSNFMDEDPNGVRIFRVLTGECVRKCRTPKIAPTGNDFPHFLWSHDGRYFAECNENAILVRDTDTFELIKDEEGKKRTLKYENLHEFQWSPKDNVIALWILEKDNNPARLVLVEIPSRTELTSRSRTQVEAQMYWQSEGDYLCLLVTKLTKNKKKAGTNLEIFRIRERNIPVETVELPDQVRVFEWETKGSRFAVLTTDEAGLHTKMCIFQLGKEKCEQLCAFEMPGNSFNSFFWAPEGQYFVVAGMTESALLFGGLTPDNKLEILHKDEHFMLTDVQWDPSSRYVITAVTQPMQTELCGFKYSMEAGFKIWTFQGRELFHQQKEKLWQISWRPHPPSLLPSNKQREIRKNIKQYSKKYDALDDQAKEQARAAWREDREQKTNAFRTILARLEEYKEAREEDDGWGEAWESLRESQEEEEQTIEEELDVHEELINP
jgi:translation initiation factor 3 subunit B